MTEYISNLTNGTNSLTIDGGVFDGVYNYPFQGQIIFQNVKFTAGQIKTYSLSNIVPQDGFDYEVTFYAYIETGTTSGNEADVQLASGTTTTSDFRTKFNTRLTRAITRANSNQVATAQATLPIYANDRNVTMYNGDGVSTGNITLAAYQIKRIGSNMRSNDTKYVSKAVTKNSSKDFGGENLSGQWGGSRTNISNSLSLASQAVKAYDLSSYLPNDDYEYEVLINVTGRTGTTSGNSVTLRVGHSTSASSNFPVCRCVTRTASYMVCGGNAKVIVGTDRKIYLSNTGGATATTVNLYLNAYKRLGKNTSEKTKAICIASKTKVPGCLIYGNPTINNGVVSGFSQTNYLEIPQAYSTDNVEFVVKFTTGSDVSRYQTIMCGEYYFNIEINTSWEVWMYNWETAISSPLFTASPNTTYWVKVKINGTTKTYSYSTDGENYIGETSFTDTGINMNYPLNIRLGTHPTLPTRVFDGSIDLNECYMDINGEHVWSGMDYRKYIPIGGYIADGPWVNSYKTVFYAATISNGSKSYNVSNYLPEDDTPYEVLLFSYGRTGATAGNSATWWLNPNSQVKGCPVLGYIITRSASSTVDAHAGKVICTQHNGQITFTLGVTSNATSGNCGLYLAGYRKIGTNE